MTQPLDPTAGASAQNLTHAPPDAEVVYYEGRPMLRADQGKASLMLFIGIILVALPVMAAVYHWNWPGGVMALCAILAIAVIAAPWLIMRTRRYKITSYRIDFERGVFTKRIDTLELWHVEDIKFEQGVLDRIMNVGSITVLSNDKTTPRLELHGLPKPRQIFEALKERVIAVKRQRGVIKMDLG